MNTTIKDILNSERTVEVEFIVWALNHYAGPNATILDVGGVPTDVGLNAPIYRLVFDREWDYQICDFRGGKYRGDFVTLDIKEKFDVIIFLSSLEHFPQCTESDCIYRHGEDRRGFLKALSLLNDNGIILLTVPFGKARWQPYHQNYDMDLIFKLSNGAELIEAFTYRLINDVWFRDRCDTMQDILYTDKAYGVGCFVFRKGVL